MQSKKSFCISSIVPALALVCGTAQAASSYGDLANPGVYFGAGNVNGNFTIGTDNGIELGLRAKNRATGALLDGSSGTYFADPGHYAGGGSKAQWNYEFSFNLSGFSDNEGLSFLLGVDHDPSAGTAYTWVDARTYFGDNATRGSSFQNSQNVGFRSTPGGAFDVDQNGLYSFVLEVRAANDNLLGSTSMNVQVGAVPEPETYALMLAGLGVIGFASRRRFKA